MPIGTIKSLKLKQLVSKLPILFKPKKELFFTNSGLNSLDTNILDQSSLVFPLRTNISISKAVSFL